LRVHPETGGTGFQPVICTGKMPVPQRDLTVSDRPGLSLSHGPRCLWTE